VRENGEEKEIPSHPESAQGFNPPIPLPFLFDWFLTKNNFIKNGRKFGGFLAIPDC
jgi:hypothetical protein